MTPGAPQVRRGRPGHRGRPVPRRARGGPARRRPADRPGHRRRPAGPATELADLLDRRRADPRRPAARLGGVIADLDVDAVVHLALVTAPDQQHGGRAAMKEQNVIGTMQLLAACQRAPRLRKLVVRSSTAAYGASFRDPAVFTEDTEPREVPRGGFARDILDIEGYVRGFRRRRPDVTATVLRFAPFIGPTADTTLTRYFAQPVVPTVLRPRPAAAVHARRRRAGGAAPVGRGGPPRHLQRRRSGRARRCPRRSGGPAGSPSRCSSRACPAPPRSPAASASASYGLDQIDLFVHGRVVDTTRLIKEFGFTPRSTAEAFDDFIRGHARPAVRRSPEASWPSPRRPSWTASGRSAPPSGSGRRERERVSRRDLAVASRGDVTEHGTAERARRRMAALDDRGRPRSTVTGAARRPGACRRGRPRHRERPDPAGPSRRCRTGRVTSGTAGRRRRWRSCAAGSPATTRSTSSASTRSSPTRSSIRCCGCSTGTGSGSRSSASSTCPTDGPALMVANHSGTVALDALMLSAALHDEHPAHRHLRLLGADLVFRMPVLSELARKSGGTLACNPDAERLLGAGELVGVFPEGFKGIGKLYADRYKLQRFGRGGFVSAALRTGTPIIPVAIVGAEEIYPMIADIKPLARLLGLPVLPGDADVPVARAARAGAAAEQVADRVRRADPHRGT